MTIDPRTIDPRTIDRAAIFSRWARQAIAYRGRTHALRHDGWYRPRRRR